MALFERSGEKGKNLKFLFGPFSLVPYVFLKHIYTNTVFIIIYDMWKSSKRLFSVWNFFCQSTTFRIESLPPSDVGILLIFFSLAQ